MAMVGGWSEDRALITQSGSYYGPDLSSAQTHQLNYYSKRGKQCYPHYTAQETGTKRVSGRALVTAVLWFWGLGYTSPLSSSVTKSQVSAHGSPCRNLRWLEAPGWATVMVPSCSTSLGSWHSGSVKTQQRSAELSSFPLWLLCLPPLVSLSQSQEVDTPGPNPTLLGV